MTQASALFYRVAILDAIKKAIKRLLRSYAPQTIVPFLYSSSGGGTGSALQVIIPMLLKKLVSQQRVLLGLNKDVLERPISMVVEPFSYAEKSAIDHSDAILANAFAYRTESEGLLQQSIIQTVFHINYSNDEAVVLGNANLAARVMAESIVELQRSYSSYKDRWVDSRAFAARRKATLDNSFSSEFPINETEKRDENNE